MGEINGRALTAIAAGSVFLWSGIKGWSILGTVGDLVTGHKPNQQVAVPLTAVGTSGSRALTPASGSGIVSVALEYQGHPYLYGGAPGPNAENPWDCSSYVNYVVGVRLGRAIPGYKPGAYTGSSHGPPTGTWGVWSGMAKIARSEVQAGDIVVWVGHMGIATGNNEMISALNPAEKTKLTPIDGYGNGPILTYGRLL